VFEFALKLWQWLKGKQQIIIPKANTLWVILCCGDVRLPA
jgi:hypothetical protein